MGMLAIIFETFCTLPFNLDHLLIMTQPQTESFDSIPTIEESSVVSTGNSLAKPFDLPSVAGTTLSELLRLSRDIKVP